MGKKNILLGVLLILLGVVFGLNALGLTEIHIFFDGWWTLFIIVPSVVGLFTERDKTGNLIGLGIGVALLLACRGLLSFGLIWKLLVPALLVIAGLSIVFKGAFGDRAARRFISDHQGDPQAGDYCATFSGQDLNFYGEQFHGARLNAIFGGVKCDLTGAVIDQDVVVDCCAVFGGIDVIVPEHYRVKICSSCIFGGVSEERPHTGQENAVTVYINGNCMFGGVSVK